MQYPEWMLHVELSILLNMAVKFHTVKSYALTNITLRQRLFGEITKLCLVSYIPTESVFPYPLRI
jgi:hypothetical protein